MTPVIADYLTRKMNLTDEATGTFSDRVNGS